MSSTGRSDIRTTLLVAIAFLLVGCGGGSGAAPRRVVERDETVGQTHVRLRSELVPARGTLGDRIAWRLTASLDRGARPGGILVARPPESLEMDGSKAPTQASEREGVVWSREYLLRGFDLGAIELPRAALAVVAPGRTDTLEFPRDTLFVDSLSTSATGSIRPDRGPIVPPLRPVDYAVAAIAAILVLAAIAFLVRAWLRRRGKRRTPAPAAAPEPAEAIFERALAALERDLGTLSRDVFYERLALAIRAYVAAATGCDALDLTTTELARELARDARTSPEGRDGVIAALRRADLAKFGRFEDEESEARSILRQARSISGRLLTTLAAG